MTVSSDATTERSGKGVRKGSDEKKERVEGVRKGSDEKSERGRSSDEKWLKMEGVRKSSDEKREKMSQFIRREIVYPHLLQVYRSFI